MRRIFLIGIALLMVIQFVSLQPESTSEAATATYVLDSTNGNFVGTGPGPDRGVAIETSETVQVSQVGIDTNISASRTYTVEIYTLTGTTLGPMVASASATLTTTGVMTTHYIPINFTFVPGTRYLVNVSGLVNGSDSITYDIFDNPTLDPVGGYTVGPFTVLDGSDLVDRWTNLLAPIITIVGEIVSVPPIAIPNIGEVLIETSNPQPVYESAGGNQIKLGGADLFLPHDADSNGFDTYTVASQVEVDGRVWVEIWLGSENFGWVPLDTVTISRTIE